MHRVYLAIGGGLLLLLLALGVKLHLANDADVRQQRDALEAWQDGVVVAVRNAIAEPGKPLPKVTAETAAEQIAQMGVDHRTLLERVEAVNQELLDANLDAERRKAAAAEAQRLAEKAIAQRNSALRRLQQDALTPSVRQDCDGLIEEADAVQNLLRQTAKEAGL